jgi:heme-degrading monooxygenase HmoA
MFIAMKRFRVAKGSEAVFEQVWMSRESHLDKVPGFVAFHFSKVPKLKITRSTPPTPCGKTVLCLKHDQIRCIPAAHHKAGDNKPLYLDHPRFEGFEVRQTVGRGKTLRA